MKRFFEEGKLEQKWILEFCKGDSSKCIRKQLEDAGKFHPDNMLPNGEIRKDKLDQIRNKLDQQIAKTGKLPLTEAVKIAEKEDVDLTAAIETLGYRIVWHGINTEKAEVIKPKNKTN